VTGRGGLRGPRVLDVPEDRHAPQWRSGHPSHEQLRREAMWRLLNRKTFTGWYMVPGYFRKDWVRL